MKLEPVFLVAPKRVPSIPTRRAFLIAGGTFALGSCLGGACGYAMGVAGAGGGVAEDPLSPSGDAELDELRRLAVKAPIEELLERRQLFVDCLFQDYPRDTVLWRGASRLCDAILYSERGIPKRREFATYFAQVIEGSDPAMAGSLRQKAPLLRKIK